MLQYGFSSFYHRDKTYLVLITIWQNALTHNPLSTESLRQELKTLKVTKEQEKLIMGRRSKSASITSDGSVDYDSSSAGIADLPSPIHVNVSGSDTIGNRTEDSDEERGRGLLPHLRHTPCSTSSSRSVSPSEDDSTRRSGSDQDTHSSTTVESDIENKTEQEGVDHQQEGVACQQEGVANTEMPRSPSLVTLRSESPREGVAEGGGSPNMFHHWKQTLTFSSAWRRVTLLRPGHVIRKPIRIISMCSTPHFINLFISIA